MTSGEHDDDLTTPEEYDGIELECPECGNYHPAPDDPAFEELLRVACDTVTQTTDQMYHKFRILEPGGRWDTDDENGVIWWTNEDGAIARADYNFVGGWIEATESFKWGWDHPHSTAATIGASDRLKLYGEEHCHSVLTTNLLLVTEHDTWHLAKITAFLSNLPGVYRAKVNDRAWAYFAFAEPSWEQ